MLQKSGEPKTMGFRFPMASWFFGAPLTPPTHDFQPEKQWRVVGRASRLQFLQNQPQHTRGDRSNELNDVQEFSKMCAKMWRLGCWMMFFVRLDDHCTEHHSMLKVKISNILQQTPPKSKSVCISPYFHQPSIICSWPKLAGINPSSGAGPNVITSRVVLNSIAREEAEGAA